MDRTETRQVHSGSGAPVCAKARGQENPGEGGLRRSRSCLRPEMQSGKAGRAGRARTPLLGFQGAWEPQEVQALLLLGVTVGALRRASGEGHRGSTTALGPPGGSGAVATGV